MTDQMMNEEQKRQLRNQRTFSFRLNLFFFATFVLFSVLIVRLATLQFVDSPRLKEMEVRAGTKDILIPPIRGTIYDASHRKIAYSTSTQSLYFRFDKDYSKTVKGVKVNQTEAIELARKIENVFAKYGDPKLPRMTADDIVKQMDLDAKMNYGYVPRRIKSGLTKEEIAYFMQHKHDFAASDIVEDSVRNYDPDTVAVQLVGYLKKYNAASSENGGLDYYKEIDNADVPPVDRYLENEDVGYDGLELLFQNELRGKNGLKSYPVDYSGNIIGHMELTKPVKGNDIWMTIHKDVQLKTEQAIMDHIKYIRSLPRSSLDAAPHARAGYAVAMEVKTGRIVAMASQPDYDPNIWRGGKISNEDYRNFEANLANGTIREVYQKYDSETEQFKHPSSVVPLGSVMKPLSVLIGLEEKLITPNTTYSDRGSFTFGKRGYERKVSNAFSVPNGVLTPSSAIEKSSNAFMSELIGNALYMRNGKKGVDLWDRYMEQFGLGVPTGSGLQGEQPGTKEYFHEAELSAQSALVFASWGQQGKYTTLQLAQYTAMLANRGKRLKPLFVSKITDAQGKTVKKFDKPEILNEVKLKKQYWDIVERGMRKVKVSGFDDFPYPLARKTGTSQQDVGGKRVENAVFIAYAPADDPVLAVAVVVPEGGFGGRGAAPIARKIFDAYDERIGLRGKPRKPAGKRAANIAASAVHRFSRREY